MDPIKPLPPMQPMAPMTAGEWWPASLGRPAASGAQNGTRYAIFPDKRRLLIEQDGTVTAYDSGDHRIGGIAQGAGTGAGLIFAGQDGPVRLDALSPLPAADR